MSLKPLVQKIDGDASGVVKAFREAEKAVKPFTEHLRRNASAAVSFNRQREQAFAKMAREAVRAEQAAAKAAAAQEKALAKAAAAAARDAEKIAAAKRKMAAASKEAAGGFTLLGTGMTALAAKGLVFAASLSRIAGVIRDVGSRLEESARVQTAKTFFEDAGNSIADFRQATKGLVSDADLIKKANLAQTMGLSADAFKSLAAIAQASAAKTGQSVSHMLDSIIVGTARESRLLLDNLGIIVDVTSAREKYIQKLRAQGKLGEYASASTKELAEALSDAGQKTAFMEAAMDAGAGVLEQYKRLGGGAAESFDRFKASMDNLKDSIGRLGTAFTPLLEALADLADRLADLEDSSLLGLLLSGGFGFMAQGDLQLSDAKITERYSPHDGKKRLQLGVLDELKKRGVTFNEALGRFDKSLLGAAEAAEYNRKRMQVWDDQTKALIDQFRALNGITKLYKTTAAEGPAQLDPAALKRLRDKKAAAAEKDARERRVTGDSDERAGPYDFYAMDAEQTRANDKMWQDAADKQMKLQQELAEDQRQLDMATRKAIRDQELRMLHEYWEERARLDSDAAGGIGMASAALSGDASGFLTMIATAIGGAFGMPQVGAAIGNLLGPALGALDGVGELFSGIAKGFNSFIELALGPLMDTLKPLGPAFELLLSVLGHLVGSALRPLIPIVSLVISGLAVLVDLLSVAVVALTPFVELASMLVTALLTLINPLYSLVDFLLNLVGIDLIDFETGIRGIAAAADQFTQHMARIIVDFNNKFVTVVRLIGEAAEEAFGTDLGLKAFGSFLEVADLLQPLADATDDNTDATVENTRAVSALARELRNLPQGYKAERAVYDAQNKLTGGSGAPTDQGWRDYMRTRA